MPRPVPVELCVGAREITEPRLSPDGTLLAQVVAEAGTAWIEVHPLDGSARTRAVVTPSPRPGRGLGGGCWCWTPDGSSIVYAATDGNLWAHRLAGGSAQRLTDHGPERTAQAPCVSPDGAHLVYVVDQAEVWTVNLGAVANSGHVVAKRLDRGAAEFCFDPVVAPDGRSVRWQAWRVPDMPWDAAHLAGCDLDGDRPWELRTPGAAQQPGFLPDGTLLAVRDDHGWANVWAGDQPIVADEVEHAGPTWGLGQRSYAASPTGRAVAFTRNERGFGRICIADRISGQVHEVGRGVHGQLSWRGANIAALRTGARTPTQVVTYSLDPITSAWERRTISVGPDAAWSQQDLVEPEAVELPARDGTVLHARLFRADEPDGRLLCWLHGGPTDQWQVTFMPRLAFWRSRGWNVLVPDHRGSTGHGRAYQQALRGRWGELDVSDVQDVLRAAHAAGWGTAGRTVLSGGSAGGFTVLCVLAAPGGADLAAAAVVSYPVTDLAELAERSHRFERHYTDTLVGPAGSPALRERSPVTFAERITRPLLVFHGADDPVVPVDQSRALIDRMRAAGADVELVVYPGEGHGFRDVSHQLDEYRRTEQFLRAHVPH